MRVCTCVYYIYCIYIRVNRRIESELNKCYLYLVGKKLKLFLIYVIGLIAVEVFRVFFIFDSF